MTNFPVADACLKPIIENEREISIHTDSPSSPPVFQRGYDKSHLGHGERCIPALRPFPRSVEELPRFLRVHWLVLKLGWFRKAGVTIRESPERRLCISAVG